MFYCPACGKPINLRKAVKHAKEEHLAKCYYCGQSFKIRGQFQLLLSVFLVLGLTLGAVYIFNIPRIIGFFFSLAVSIYLAKTLIKLERVFK